MQRSKDYNATGFGQYAGDIPNYLRDLEDALKAAQKGEEGAERQVTRSWQGLLDLVMTLGRDNVDRAEVVRHTEDHLLRTLDGHPERDALLSRMSEAYDNGHRVTGLGLEELDLSDLTAYETPEEAKTRRDFEGA